MLRTRIQTLWAARTVSCVLAVTVAQALAACDIASEEPTVSPTFSFAGVGGVAVPPAMAGFGVAGAVAAAPQPSLQNPFFGPVSQQLVGPITRADNPPPPISGGTLLTAAAGSKLVAADPDRDAVYVIDVATGTLERRIELRSGDEPGRVVEDAAGRIHVVLRGGRSIVTFDLASDAKPRRSEVCDLPRGLAFDALRGHLYVACAEGWLVQLDPATGVRERRVELGRDLRDVVVRGEALFVTRFRSAELIALDAETGLVSEVRTPPVAKPETSPPGTSQPSVATDSPDVMWRTIDVPQRGVVMLHQRAQDGLVRLNAGGYAGGQQCSGGIVHGALTIDARDGFGTSFNLGAPGLHVDVAAEPTGSRLAVANPGAWGVRPGVQIYESLRLDNPFGAQASGGGPACTPPLLHLWTAGQATAVTFVTPQLVAAQTREPAAIEFFDLTATPPPGSSALQATTRLDLKQPSRDDSGHAMFHVAAGVGLACASCHPEGGDDGHVWTFDGIGARRTQSLRGGIAGTEPFHWNGDMRDFSMLVAEVFVKRMGGPEAEAPRAEALAHWIDRQPALHTSVPEGEADAVARGRVLFESNALACAGCHAGARFSNDKSEFVGTGVALQVPSLVGVSFRLPLMHDGCAKTLEERFGTCGGGEKHGHTAQLTAAQRSDLIAFLRSL